MPQKGLPRESASEQKRKFVLMGRFVADRQIPRSRALRNFCDRDGNSIPSACPCSTNATPCNRDDILDCKKIGGRVCRECAAQKSCNMRPSFEDRIRSARRLEDQIRGALRHVELGRAIIEHHRQLFEKRLSPSPPRQAFSSLWGTEESRHSRSAFSP